MLFWVLIAQYDQEPDLNLYVNNVHYVSMNLELRHQDFLVYYFVLGE